MVNIVAEIGINHNGSMDLVKKMIDLSSVAGCDFVKFQKRNPDDCVPAYQKDVMKQTPWGDMTYLEYRKRVELSQVDYKYIDTYCNDKGIGWFTSVWDIKSAQLMSKFNNIVKIPSALITNTKLCKLCRKLFDKLIISTGMSNEEEIEKCINECSPNVVMHTNSSYPASIDELNLNYIYWLSEKYEAEFEIGYSGHEYGLTTTFAAAAMGTTWIERHITLDRNMWGSDQKSSIEPSGLIKLVKGIRSIEKALGHYGPRIVNGSELDKRKSLRGV